MAAFVTDQLLYTQKPTFGIATVACLSSTRFAYPPYPCRRSRSISTSPPVESDQAQTTQWQSFVVLHALRQSNETFHASPPERESLQSRFDTTTTVIFGKLHLGPGVHKDCVLHVHTNQERLWPCATAARLAVLVKADANVSISGTGSLDRGIPTTAARSRQA